MRCLETALGLALLALGATACEPCWCGLSITDLRTAWCENTALTSIPSLPVDTQQIWIWVGNISSLQEGEFDGYTNLTHIELRYNPLTELPSEIFSKTVNVIEIDLRYNKIKILQSYLFSNLKYLQGVWLGGNQISVLEENCFFNVPQLRVIDFKSNHLSKINQSFINDYSSLQILALCDNPVYCDDGICELMNRVVQRELYGVDEDRMPSCAGPPTVQNKTWAEAVEALWGAGPERCPRRVDTALKELLVAELNKSSTVLEAVHTQNMGLKAEQEKLKGVVDVLVRETQANRNAQEAAYGFFKTEMTTTRSEVQHGLRQVQNSINTLLKEELNKSSRERKAEQEKLKGVVEAAHGFFKTELNKSSRILEELHTENLGLKAEQEKLKGVVEVLVRETQANRNAQEAAYGFFKTDVNETRSELQLVKKDLHSELLALKEDVGTLLEQTKQDKDVANILFKKVYHSKGKGVLVLRYSVLPSPDNTSLPAP